MKKLIVIASSLMLALPAAAQIVPTQNIRQQIQDTRQSAGELKAAAKADFEAKRMEAKNLMEQKKAEFKNKVETARTELKTRIETKKRELKTKLAKIKDERKKQVVEKIDGQLDELNKRRMDHFSQVLEQIEKVLDKISGRTAKAEANGRDVSAVKSAISEAQNSIAASRSAVQTQAVKTYTITITTENALRQDVGKARQALHADLVKVEDTVKAAREAVRKAATTLAQIPNVNDLEVSSGAEATTTPTSTTSTGQ